MTVMSSFKPFSMLLAVLLAGAAMAQQADDDPNAAVWQAASAAMLRGPQSVPLRNQANLQLPEGYGFVPHAEAVRLMEIMGNQTDPNFIGMIFPLGAPGANWFVTVDFDDAG